MIPDISKIFSWGSKLQLMVKKYGRPSAGNRGGKVASCLFCVGWNNHYTNNGWDIWRFSFAWQCVCQGSEGADGIQGPEDSPSLGGSQQGFQGRACPTSPARDRQPGDIPSPGHQARPWGWEQAKAGPGHRPAGRPSLAQPMPRQGQALGKLETGPSGASPGQGLTALGGLRWGAGFWTGWGEPRRWAGTPGLAVTQGYVSALGWLLVSAFFPWKCLHSLCLFEFAEFTDYNQKKTFS